MIVTDEMMQEQDERLNVALRNLSCVVADIDIERKRMISEAVLAERVRCALIVETRMTGFDYVPQPAQERLRKALADAIRSGQ